jgi:hypothetical protein
MVLRTLGLALGLVLAAPALAQDDGFELDDDFDIEGGEEDEEEEQERLEKADDLESTESTEQQDQGLDDFRDTSEDGEEETGETMDLLDEEPVAPDAGDSEKLYRDTEATLKRLGADEQLAGWEQYLASYPTTVFRPRIEARMDELMTELYSGRISTGDGGNSEVDALRAEIPFSQAMQLENLNPRTRLQAGFEWGLPSYVNLLVDYEHALARSLSVHGGVRRRYQGWNIEGGVRWALVKSTRTDTIISLIGDVRLNANPAYPAFRPQLAAGKIFGEKLHLQLQAGPDLAVQEPFGLRIVGGAAAYFAASDVVGVFAETKLDFKSLGEDQAFQGGLFTFNVLSFGMKFYPKNKNKPESQDVEVNFGATVPYWQEYWQFHYGSVMGQANYYL